jgi:hypothetical protein
LNTIEPNFNAWFNFLFSADIVPLEGIVSHVLLEPRSFFFVKILSLLYLFTGKSYWISSLYLSLFSFWGGWFIIRKIICYWPALKCPALISFLYFPTLTFWSSGVLKESLAFGCIMTLGGIIITGFQKRSIGWGKIGFGLLLIWVLWSVKYHYVAVMILSLMAGIAYTLIFRAQWIKYRYVWLILIILLVIAGLSRLHPNFHLTSLIDVLRENHNKIIDYSNNKNIVYFIPYGTGWIHFLINLPVSSFAGLFMPLPWQGAGLLPKLVGIVNFLILLMTLFKFKKIRDWKWSLNQWNVILVIYILTMAIFMAYAAPNFGTLERYKTGYIPFFLFWILNNKNLILFLRKCFHT